MKGNFEDVAFNMKDTTDIPTGLRKRLHELLEYFTDSEDVNLRDLELSILSLFSEYALDIIGSDEKYEYIDNRVELKRNDKREYRNKFRAEQRLKVANGDSK